jgi:uncharacterized membrane protein
MSSSLSDILLGALFLLWGIAQLVLAPKIAARTYKPDISNRWRVRSLRLAGVFLVGLGVSTLTDIGQRAVLVTLGIVVLAAAGYWLVDYRQMDADSKET